MSPHILIAGWAGAGNLGDELIAAALANLLHERGAVAGMYSEDPPATSALHGVIAFPTRSIRAPRRWADGFILGPGGLLQDQTSAISCAVHLGRFAVVGAARPTAGIGLGVGPISRWPSRASLRLAARTQPRWITRDRASQELLATLGFRHTAVAPDLAHLALAKPNHQHSEHDVRQVVLAPRGTVVNRSDRAAELAAAITTSRIHERVDVALLAMTPEDEAVGADAISLIEQSSRDRIPSMVRPTPAEASSPLQPGDHVISGRFHVALMANHFGNGWSAIDSGHKMRSYAHDSGVSTYPETEAGLTKALESVPSHHRLRPQPPTEREYEPLYSALEQLISQARRASG